MHRRLAFFFLFLVLCVSGAGNAHAAPRDAAATQKIDEAINTHYLATEFDKAEALLKGVIDACEDRCSPGVKARAWMYIGIVKGSGKQDIAGAQGAFQQAMALDPTVKLDDALATPQVRQAFSNAAAALGQTVAPTTPDTGTGTTTTTTTTTTAAPAAPGPTLPGNMECTPTVTEVEMQRQIPVACTTDEPAVKVVLRYMVFGGDQWQQVQMTQKAEYWQGAIPCSDTGVTGAIKWYVEAKDKDGEQLDSHGNKKTPAEINVVTSTTEPPPAYPGQPAPQKCMAASECPEEMIGTPACPTGGGPKARGDKGWGAPCDTSQECDTGLLCQQGDSGRTCETAPRCDVTSDCPSGSVCKGGTCDVGDEDSGSSTPSGHYKKNLIGLHFAADFASLSGKDVCDPGTNFNCYYAGGVPYPNTPFPGAGGNLNGGLAPATFRVLASYERLITRNIGLEGRVGFAFNGGPKSANGTAFLPIHVEARAKYWFGHDLFSRKGIRPYVFLGGGIAQVDARLTVRVADAQTVNTPSKETSLDAYRKLGQSFVGGGGGVMYAVAPNHGVVLNLNFDYMLPSSGLVIEPSLGYELAL